MANQPDIAKETLKVGNALASVRIDQMIVNMAKGIAEGQFQLDQKSVEILKMMGVPGTVTIGDEKLSMLDAGFAPSFYQFVDTILEMKMEVKMRSEDSTVDKTKTETKLGAEVSFSAGWGWGKASVKATAAYTKAVDTTHSQKFSQDLSAQSLMRTKLVPVPVPEVLKERIQIYLDKLKEESADEADYEKKVKEDFIGTTD